MNRIVLTTGGTGGHVFPAIAVARELTDRYPQCEILFLGGKGPEREMVERAGIKFKGLPAKGIVGGGIRKLLSSFWIAGGLFMSVLELLRFKPEAVIGFGGYAGFCPVLGGAMLGIPCAIHEQNSVPGVTNKVLGRFVKKVFASFEDKEGAFPSEKVMLTGNPVRKEIVECAQHKPGSTVLVFGGSQGASAINEAVVDALALLKKAGIKLFHQTGKNDLQKVRKAYEAAGYNPDCVQPFIHNMAEAYAEAALVICRSGASTVFEISAAGKPAVFIPFPHATHDHQTSNAKRLAEIGAAKIIPQNELSGEKLAETIIGLIASPNNLNEMRDAALSFARPGAAASVVDGLETIINSKARG
ncbi:undecaprenyldiphospho-muramoylpentapeptide beta-N-acetylglucosaminyltransferase [Maridesulfovibrio bastinii]|uniref:undecaprenyldiphospho-muramoylpentapeptide beta-N-acetylglucosaminyltransferase n=1 Tax=Maridesulfovibrio bastinii TaxID=47157 RepID=UPI00041FBE24|nr:undecaprenyldiphospho-muramoylpentapeptide beta-N-acetylglucosaminyltransferase [Maridesulfovibrio bastinii]